jgi:hypothetical protein
MSKTEQLKESKNFSQTNSETGNDFSEDFVQKLNIVLSEVSSFEFLVISLN